MAENEPGTWSLKKSVVILWGVATVTLLGLNAALLWQNREVKLAESRRLADQQRKAAEGKTVSEVPVGSVIEPLHGKGIDGKELIVDTERPTLLLVFSPACGFCKKNWPQWQRLTEGLKEKGVQTVAVDTSSSVTPEYVSLYKFTDATVVQGLSKDVTKKYRFRFTPITILTKGGGVVERSWAGVLDDKVLAEFQAAIDRLPRT